MKALQSKIGQGVLSFAVSGALLLWMAMKLDWNGVGDKIVGMHFWALIPVTIILLVQYALRTWRWRLLLPNIDGSTAVTPESKGSLFRLLLDSILVGNLASYVLPLRAGEFIRPYLLSIKSEYRFSIGFISVVIERLFDLAFVLLSFGLLLYFIPAVPAWVHKGAFSLAIVAAGILGFVTVSCLFPVGIRKLVAEFCGYFPVKVSKPLEGFLNDLVTGAAVLKTFQNLVLVVALTLVIWILTYSQFYAFLFCFDGPHSPLLGIALGVIIALAVAAPSAPGFIGVYQTACLASFALVSPDPQTAGAFSIVTHAYQFLFIGIAGVVALFNNKLSLGELQRRKTETQPV